MIDPVFREVLTLLGFSVVAIVVFHRLRVPTSLGYSRNRWWCVILR